VLLAGYQASLLGQLFRRFEAMSACGGAMGGTLDPSHKGPSAGAELSPRASAAAAAAAAAGAAPAHTHTHSSPLWESGLRRCYRRGAVWEDAVAPRERRVPFLVRGAPPPAQRRSPPYPYPYPGGAKADPDRGGGAAPCPASFAAADYLQWALALQGQGQGQGQGGGRGAATQGHGGGGGISDFSLLEMYLRAAVSQIQRLADGVGAGAGAGTGTGAGALSAGELSLLLHILHALGVGVGLCLRCGVALPPSLARLTLSPHCWRIIVGEEGEGEGEGEEGEDSGSAIGRGSRAVSVPQSSGGGGGISEGMKGAVIRRGIISVVPEVYRHAAGIRGVFMSWDV
jgi:hypothetical protein